MTDTEILNRMQPGRRRDMTARTLAEGLDAYERMKEIACRPEVPERVWLSFAVTHRELFDARWVLDVHRKIVDAKAEEDGFSVFSGREQVEEWPSTRIVSYSRLYVARGDA